jgi:hypothetical protein
MKAQETMSKINEWIREPDYAEDFSLEKMADWLNRRPIAEVARLAAQADAPSGEPTIDSVPSCGQENDYRRAAPAQPQADARTSADNGEAAHEPEVFLFYRDKQLFHIHTDRRVFEGWMEKQAWQYPPERCEIVRYVPAQPQAVRETGLGWTISEETKRQIEEIDRNIREAPLNIARAALSGKPGEPPQASAVIPAGEIEPALEGTIIGKLRLFMRSVCIWERAPAQILDALGRAGLELVHKQNATAQAASEESVAEIVYDAFPYRNGDSYHEGKPKWVPGGNSLMQDRARQAARAILALSRPERGINLSVPDASTPAQRPHE